MKKYYIYFLALITVIFYPTKAYSMGDWNNSTGNSFSFRILRPVESERFLKDERIRLEIDPWDEEEPRVFVCLTHTGIEFDEIKENKMKVFNDAYFYAYHGNWRADLDITNVIPGKYTLWVEIKDEYYNEIAVGSIDISIIGKAAETGWLLAGDGNYYYLRGNKAVRNEWLLIKTRWYAFDNAGLMYRGWADIDQDWFYFDDNGGLCYGWLDYSDYRFYLGDLGRMCTGWQKIDGSLYYFNEKGQMQTGEQVIDDKTYTFDEMGKMVNGDPNVSLQPMGKPTISIEPIVEY